MNSENPSPKASVQLNVNNYESFVQQPTREMANEASPYSILFKSTTSNLQLDQDISLINYIESRETPEDTVRFLIILK